LWNSKRKKRRLIDGGTKGKPSNGKGIEKDVNQKKGSLSKNAPQFYLNGKTGQLERGGGNRKWDHRRWRLKYQILQHYAVGLGKGRVSYTLHGGEGAEKKQGEGNKRGDVIGCLNYNQIHQGQTNAH